MTNPVKDKTPSEERVYDLGGYCLRAACVCVRGVGDEGEVLLVSSPRRDGSWIVPGGKRHAEEKPEDSATREAFEEAGAVGFVDRFLGEFDNHERKHRTSVFVLKVTQLKDEYEDQGRRKRAWFPLDEAHKLLRAYKPMHSKYLTALTATGTRRNNPVTDIKQIADKVNGFDQNNGCNGRRSLAEDSA